MKPGKTPASPWGARGRAGCRSAYKSPRLASSPMANPLVKYADELKDLLRGMGLLAGYVPAALIPARLDAPSINALAWLLFRLRPGKVSAFSERMARTLGERPGERDLSKEAKNHYQMVLEGSWARVRNLHERGWKPKTSVEGLDWLEAGRAAGAGTILWRMPFGSTLTVKAGLYGRGVPIVHLSQRYHRASSRVWTSIRVLCPLFRRAEDWYLVERVIIPGDGSTAKVMRTLLDRLKNGNAVVSIMGNTLGTQNTWTRFFDGWAGFAIGSPALAWKAGSALLPVFSVREGTGRHRVVIQEPIAVDRTLPRKAFVKKATEEFSERLQDAIRQYPGSWKDWGRFWSRAGAYEMQTDAGLEED